MVIPLMPHTGRTGGEIPRLEEGAIAALRSRFRGELIQPGDETYEPARRVWNGAIDRHPALVARATGVADVQAAVRFTRERTLALAVRGGGHNVAGTAVCDGGLVLDCSPMKGVWIDPVARTARAQPGLLWGELDRETHAFGLATTGGIITHTGIAGLTLGGGLGWLMRKHGLACDNLLSADVVTADGECLRACKTEHADLFWGLRGGGGNFGVVTSFEYRLHPVGTVLAGPVLYPADAARAVLGAYRDWLPDAPDELTTIVVLRTAPPAPFLPPEVHGRPVVVLGACYAGRIEDGERAVAPLRRLGGGEPRVDLLRPTPYVAHQSLFDATAPHGLGYYWKSEYLTALSDEAIEVLIEDAWPPPTPMSYTIMFHLGGAVARTDPEASAFEDRRADHALVIDAVWSDPADEDAAVAWARSFWERVGRFATGRLYVNFLGEEGPDRVRAAYGATKYDRLRALKGTYDPTNFFRLNQNIAP
jgi:FAD/FMN-containing dehydrogenase